MFRVGQKVVCISNEWRESREGFVGGFSPNPVKGNIYTIEFTELYEGEVYLVLEEIKDVGFVGLKFRPLELDYNFVEEVIKQVQPIKEEA